MQVNNETRFENEWNGYRRDDTKGRDICNKGKKNEGREDESKKHGERNKIDRFLVAAAAVVVVVVIVIVVNRNSSGRSALEHFRVDFKIDRYVQGAYYPVCSIFLRNASTNNSTRLMMSSFLLCSNIVVILLKRVLTSCASSVSFAYVTDCTFSKQTNVSRRYRCNSNGKHGAVLLHMYVFQFCAEIAFALNASTEWSKVYVETLTPDFTWSTLLTLWPFLGFQMVERALRWSVSVAWYCAKSNEDTW